MDSLLRLQGYLQVQNVIESRINFATKSGRQTHQKCRGIAAFAVELRLYSGIWPRALARGFSWSVHLVVCFWKFDPGSLSWDLDITWESSYLDFKSPNIFIHEFPYLCTLIFSFYPHLQEFRVGQKSILPSSLIIATLALVYLHFDN